MTTSSDCSDSFINYILENTNHTISSLSEILSIPHKRLACGGKLTRYDLFKIDKLRKLLRK